MVQNLAMVQAPSAQPYGRPLIIGDTNSNTALSSMASETTGHGAARTTGGRKACAVSSASEWDNVRGGHDASATVPWDWTVTYEVDHRTDTTSRLVLYHTPQELLDEASRLDYSMHGHEARTVLSRVGMHPSVYS